MGSAKSRSERGKGLSMGRCVWAVIALFTVLFGCRRSIEQSVSQYRVQELPGSLIEDTVRLEGTAPSPKKIHVAQDVDVCGETRDVFLVRVDNGGVDDAVVWIDDTIVTTSFPSHSSVRTRQDSTGSPSRRTVHAPHPPSSHPCFVPMRFRSSRSTSSNVL